MQARRISRAASGASLLRVYKTRNRIGEYVIAVADHHMSGAEDIDEFDLGEARQQPVGVLLAARVAPPRIGECARGARTR